MIDDTNYADRSAHACIACGYVELFIDPATVRCLLAGVKPPKQGKKPGLL